VSCVFTFLQVFLEYQRWGSNRHGAFAPPDFESCLAGPPRLIASGNLAYLCGFQPIRKLALSRAYEPVLARLQYECGRYVVIPGGWVDLGKVLLGRAPRVLRPLVG
jgi:hypothetical protein